MPPYAHTRACVYIGRSPPTAACKSAIGAEGGAPGQAAPHESVVAVATDIAAESVIEVPLVADTVVPDVMPVPEMTQPTQGGVAGVAVVVSAVDELVALPLVPVLCDVKTPS